MGDPVRKVVINSTTREVLRVAPSTEVASHEVANMVGGLPAWPADQTFDPANGDPLKYRYVLGSDGVVVVEEIP